jgi:hypothetical protein
MPYHDEVHGQPTRVAGSCSGICELLAADRGLSDLLSMTLSEYEQVEQLRRTANERVVTLVDRG